MFGGAVKDYIIAGLAIAVLVLGAATAIQTQRVKAVKAEHRAFVADVRAKGEIALAAAKAQAKRDKDRQEKANEANQRDIAVLRADNKRLRDQRAGSSYVPPAASGASRPDLACFDRGELEQAIRRFDARVSGIVEQGDESRVNLDTAKQWANP